MFMLMLVCNLLMTVLAEDFKDLNTTELLKLAIDVSQIVPINPRSSDVQFYLLDDIEAEPKLINSSSYGQVNLEKPMKMVIHGWLENHKRSWYKNIANAYLKSDNINLVGVDWNKLARQPYLYSVASTSFVGQEIANFIQNLKIYPGNIHLIGHSLGSHVAGFTGKEIFKSTGQKVARISALDPAGPHFRQPSIPVDERLDKDDAEIVDVIHTDAGFYGYENPIGTLDIYVNRGKRIQPGCLDVWEHQSVGNIIEACEAHARSIKYFVEWVNNRRFDCAFCNISSDYNNLLKRCPLSENTVMVSTTDVDKGSTGICFANTTKNEPFLN